MRMSLTQLADVTGRDRHTIRKQLDSLPSVNGKKGALLYDSKRALSVIYQAGNLEDARAKHALSQVSLNAVREEDLRKNRIPLEEILDVLDFTFQSIAATLKAAKFKKLTPELINEIFDKIRAGFAKIK
jgi:hypothetical protein